MRSKYTTQEREYTCRYVGETPIEGLFVLERSTSTDERGFFREVFHLDELEIRLGYNVNFVQMNHSVSNPRVIRALHAENWNKLVYPITGEVFIAIADIRPHSNTFCQVENFTISSLSRRALFVEAGLANSICVIGDEPVHYLYLVDQYYDGRDQRAIAWDDPDLDVQWPVSNPILSNRDKNNPKLADLYPHEISIIRSRRGLSDYSI